VRSGGRTAGLEPPDHDDREAHDRGQGGLEEGQMWASDNGEEEQTRASGDKEEDHLVVRRMISRRGRAAL
jgi:hypothetical protein